MQAAEVEVRQLTIVTVKRKASRGPDVEVPIKSTCQDIALMGLNRAHPLKCEMRHHLLFVSGTACLKTMDVERTHWMEALDNAN
ncbi:unnamed protein product [Hydatigera taeniaeformis]|uniref:PH domain-containing protein n=1 Tax=Hydatigena taeniaeformis TaxID=6205 RepID=A0A0R3XCM1_HYDTA|nr:unnamed protein product [Hydatigera taeniaeformis]